MLSPEPCSAAFSKGSDYWLKAGNCCAEEASGGQGWGSWDSEVSCLSFVEGLFGAQRGRKPSRGLGRAGEGVLGAWAGILSMQGFMTACCQFFQSQSHRQREENIWEFSWNWKRVGGGRRVVFNQVWFIYPWKHTQVKKYNSGLVAMRSGKQTHSEGQCR